MPQTSNLINYRTRPSKNAERKMVFEIIHKIITRKYFENQYQYIGFGATEFIDFRLAHRILEIDNMISIESDKNIKRFEFNKPYSFVSIKSGESTEVLPDIVRSNMSKICWLDYDGAIKPSVFDDIEIFCNDAREGDFFIITCNHSSYCRKERVKKFCDDFGDRVPLLEYEGGNREIENSDLSQKNIHNVIKVMIDNTINNVLDIVNNTTRKKLKYQQLFFCKYKDVAPMLTIGGVFVKEDDVLDRFSYTNSSTSFDKNCNEIKMPILTSKEIKTLQAFIPYSNFDEIESVVGNIGISQEEVDCFNNNYKYYPHYHEIMEI